MKIECTGIGTMSVGRKHSLKVIQEVSAGLTGLDGFSHALLIWYADRLPPWKSEMSSLSKPYRLAPETLGVFATRSPLRPNPLCVSVAAISSIDQERGEVEFFWTDIADGTPILDIKPYHPSSDRVEKPSVPSWCAHWPLSIEESGDFDWEGEFLF